MVKGELVYMQKLVYVTREDCTFSCVYYDVNSSKNKTPRPLKAPKDPITNPLNYYLQRGWKVISVTTDNGGAFVLIER